MKGFGWNEIFYALSCFGSFLFLVQIINFICLEDPRYTSLKKYMLKNPS